MVQHNKQIEIGTAYDPKALTSTLPIRKAAALVVHSANNKVLVVRRSQIVDEFKGVWSLPSSFIDNHDENIAITIQERLKLWLDLDITNMRLVGKRMGIRPRWRLLMYLFLAESINEPAIQTNKYDAFKWVMGPEYFSQFNNKKLGECTKAYLDYVDAIPNLPLV